MSATGVGSIIRHVLTAIVVMAVLMLVASVSALIGTLLMLAYSGRAVVRAYRQDLPLTRVTCLLPVTMAVGCFALQLMAFAPSNAAFVLMGAVAGAGIGIILGRSHKVFAREGLIYARQTSTYLVFWVLINIATQLSGMVGWRDVADLALASGALMTATVATLHVMLLYRSGSVQAAFAAERRTGVSSWLLALLAVTAALAFTHAPTYAQYAVAGVRDALNLVLQPGDFGPPVTVREVPWREAIERQSRLPSSVLAALGIGTRWETAANVYSAQLGPTLGLQSNLVLFYAPSTIELLRDLQYVAVRGMARSWVALGQEWERSDPGHRQYNPRAADCGEHCTEITYECGYLAVRSTGNWHAIFLLTLYTAPPAGVFGAEPGDPAPEICAQIQVPDWGRRLFGLIDQRLGQLDYQGSVASSITGDPASMAGIVGALLQLLAAIGSAGAAAAAQSAAAIVQGAASRAAQAAATAHFGTTPATGTARPAATQTLTGTRILDGDKAVAWLKEHHYLKPNGERDDRFTGFMNSLPSESRPGLQTFAGDIDPQGNPTGFYAIVVTDVPIEPEPEPPPPPPPPPTIVWPPNSEEPPSPEPGPTGPSATQLRDRWRTQEQELKQQIDHKRQRMTELKDTLTKLEHEYNITRYAACSDAVIDALDVAVQIALKTSESLAETALNRLDTNKVSGAWWKELIKGGIKEFFRQAIRYAETGESKLERPELIKRLLDCYGVKKDAPPGGALKQWLLNILEKKTGSKEISNVGFGEDFFSIYKDTVENMEKSERLRSQINTYASEYRELDSDVADLTDDYSKVKAWADLAERDIAGMRKPRHDI
jgi:hypothetical protein